MDRKTSENADLTGDPVQFRDDLFNTLVVFKSLVTTLDQSPSMLSCQANRLASPSFQKLHWSSASSFSRPSSKQKSPGFTGSFLPLAASVHAEGNFELCLRLLLRHLCEMLEFLRPLPADDVSAPPSLTIFHLPFPIRLCSGRMFEVKSKLSPGSPTAFPSSAPWPSTMFGRLCPLAFFQSLIHPFGKARKAWLTSAAAEKALVAKVAELCQGCPAKPGLPAVPLRFAVEEGEGEAAYLEQYIHRLLKAFHPNLKGAKA